MHFCFQYAMDSRKQTLNLASTALLALYQTDCITWWWLLRVSPAVLRACNSDKPKRVYSSTHFNHSAPTFSDNMSCHERVKPKLILLRGCRHPSQPLFYSPCHLFSCKSWQKRQEKGYHSIGQSAWQADTQMNLQWVHEHRKRHGHTLRDIESTK